MSGLVILHAEELKHRRERGLKGRRLRPCMAPGCDNLTDRDICDSCDVWVDEQVALLSTNPGDRP